MDFFAAFLLRVLKVIPQPGGGQGRMRVTLKPAYAYLKEELQSAFEGNENVQVLVERRHGERRTTQHHVGLERRRGDRRRAKEELVEAVILIQNEWSGTIDPDGTESE